MAASRKLYAPMAKTIARHVDMLNYERDWDDTAYAVWVYGLVRDIATEFKQDNHNFQRDKFVDACGLSEIHKTHLFGD